MDKTIEAKFFKAFEFGGVLHNCFDWMSQKYDLGFKFSREDENKPYRPLPKKWQDFYDKTLPEYISEQTDAFDNSVIDNYHSPLIDEISNNLDECKTAVEKERYIFSLLKPFKEFSDNFNPVYVIKELKGDVKGVIGIRQEEEHIKFWENQLKDKVGDLNAQKQITACKHFIEEYKYRIDRAGFIAERYRNLLNDVQKGTVEYNMSKLISVVFRFTHKLDALLLEHGLNLLWYQKECGIYLMQYRDMTMLESYIGSFQLAQKYISEARPIFPEPQQHGKNKIVLPDELDTDRARKYFLRAIKKGYMVEYTYGFKWCYNSGSKVSLAYFIQKVFCPNNTETLPEKAINQLFGVNRIGSAISQILTAKKPQKWQALIDELLE